jgi:hypothetical protein
MFSLHQNDRMRALSRTRALSSLSSTPHSYDSPTKQWTERLRSILLFSQTKNGVVLFCSPSTEWNSSIPRYWNGAAPSQLAPQPNAPLISLRACSVPRERWPRTIPDRIACLINISIDELEWIMVEFRNNRIGSQFISIQTQPNKALSET